MRVQDLGATVEDAGSGVWIVGFRVGARPCAAFEGSLPGWCFSLQASTEPGWS